MLFSEGHSVQEQTKNALAGPAAGRGSARPLVTYKRLYELRNAALDVSFKDSNGRSLEAGHQLLGRERNKADFDSTKQQ